jgi:hypothetical protein
MVDIKIIGISAKFYEGLPFICPNNGTQIHENRFSLKLKSFYSI